MVNSWQTSYIRISMPTHQGSDTIHVFEDDFMSSNGMKAQSQYHSDGTFESWYVHDGKESNRTSGKWKIIGEDSLQIEYHYDNRDVKTTYFINAIEDGFKGVNIYDWDNDGVKDDTLLMKTKSIEL